ncbi:tellurite resistance/C4-dicarboxylate transporter family protein [Streptomyces sp. NPDC004542]|uniref:tellurite resistance/C4-dicarboxylate transporter family protein n=1 Tax=Streptomyces sp. NPDC004542 TaxID=3154281 RepID=UPI0033BC0860
MHGTASPLRVRWARWARRSPAAGAAVMATGIVSVALQQAGRAVLSQAALGLACAAWLGFAAGFALWLLRERRAAPTPSALTAVAATAVLGTRFALLGRQVLAGALLALAVALWPVLLVHVLRRWERRMPGAVFLGCVATESIAALGAVLARATATAWLAHLALVLFWLGLVFYGLAAARFDPRQLLEGAGDQWIVGGALAVSALAGARLVAVGSTRPYLWSGDDQGVLRAVTAALLVLDGAWYAVLLVAEAVRPRPGYDVRRWSTVFPMGMTAAATLSAGTALGIPWLRGPGVVLVWVSVAAWLAVAVGAVRSTARR